MLWRVKTIVTTLMLNSTFSDAATDQFGFGIKGNLLHQAVSF